MLSVARSRPATSFLWFTSPWKTFKFIVWRRFKVYFITGLIMLLIILFIALFFYAVPVGVSVNYINYYCFMKPAVSVALALALHPSHETIERYCYSERFREMCYLLFLISIVVDLLRFSISKFSKAN